MADPSETVRRLWEKATSGRAVLAAGVGGGLVAKAAERGGADLLILYSSGRFRAAGRGSLAAYMPYGDANEIVLELAGEVLPLVDRAPVVAGVCATDPRRVMRAFLGELAALGIAGVQNFPTVGLIDGQFRRALEESGICYEQEVELIREASTMGLLTVASVFDADSARTMAAAGADLVVAHLGATVGGVTGPSAAVSIAEAARVVQAVQDAAGEGRDDVLVLFHGGPASTPGDVQRVLEATRGVAGYLAASSIERIPVETAVEEAARAFAGLALGPTAKKGGAA